MSNQIAITPPKLRQSKLESKYLQVVENNLLILFFPKIVIQNVQPKQI